MEDVSGFSFQETRVGFPLLALAAAESKLKPSQGPSLLLSSFWKFFFFLASRECETLVSSTCRLQWTDSQVVAMGRKKSDRNKMRVSYGSRRNRKPGGRFGNRNKLLRSSVPESIQESGHNTPPAPLTDTNDSCNRSPERPVRTMPVASSCLQVRVLY